MQRVLLIVVIIALSGARICYADDQVVDVKMMDDYLRLAQRGDVSAQFYLGALYAQGVGVSQSDVEAFRWFLSAAQRGHSQSRLVVGEMYAVGRGVPKVMWMLTSGHRQPQLAGIPLKPKRAPKDFWTC